MVLSLVGRASLGLRPIQHKTHPRRPVRSVAPRMVGAALDQHVARLHQGLADVHQRPDLALDDDGVVENRTLRSRRVKRTFDAPGHCYAWRLDYKPRPAAPRPGFARPRIRPTPQPA